MVSKARIGRRTGIARYHQLYTLLLRGLSDGTSRPGSALPSETELVRRYGVSRNTVRRALGQLEKERRIVRRRGSGTYAAESQPDAARRKAMDRLRADPGRFGDAVRSEILHWASIGTPDFVTARCARFGDRCLYVQRRFTHRGHGFALVTSFVPEQMAGHLSQRAVTGSSVLEVLARSGYRASRGERAITAVAADAGTATLLETSIGAPLIAVQTVVFGRQGLPLELAQELYRPDASQVDLRLRFAPRGRTLAWTATSPPATG